jgi:rhodanese-related sulfurtransferase
MPLHQEKPMPNEVRDVHISELSALTPELRIVDVREPDEFHGELGHIEGSELVPLASVTEVARDWNRSQPLLMVCRSGRRSMTAATRLVEMGFEQVMNLNGGMLAYRAQGGKK